MPTKASPSEWIHAWVQPGMKTIDVGAAGGSLTRLMAEQVGPTGHVWAIEPRPAPDRVAGLRASFPHVTWLPVAAWSEWTTVPFFVHDEQSSCWPELAASDQQVAVPAAPLDDLVQAPVDLIKIDAQGAEGWILAGASRHLRECPCWIFEMWPKGLKMAGRDAMSVFRQFTAAGYVVQWLEHSWTSISDDVFGAWAQRVEETNAFINMVASRIGPPPSA